MVFYLKVKITHPPVAKQGRSTVSSMFGGIMDPILIFIFGYNIAMSVANGEINKNIIGGYGGFNDINCDTFLQSPSIKVRK